MGSTGGCLGGNGRPRALSSSFSFSLIVVIDWSRASNADARNLLCIFWRFFLVELDTTLYVLHRFLCREKKERNAQSPRAETRAATAACLPAACSAAV